MSKYDIVEAIARNKTVEKIARHYNTPYRDDLCQYIYYWLLTKTDEDMLNELYCNGQIKQFIAGIIYRQIFSDHSHHYRQNAKRIGEPIVKTNKNGDTYEETLVYDDTPPHEIEDEVDDYLNSLPEMEKEIMWLQLVAKDERTDDIRNICSRYKISSRKYTYIVPKVKDNFIKHFNFKKQNKQKGKYNSTKVEMIDFKTGELVRTFANMGECKLELEPKGFNIHAIYSCLISRQKQHNGYIFRYQL